MNKLNDIEDKIEEYKKEIKKLNDVLKRDKEKDFYDKITLRHKYYKFKYDYIDYLGIVTDFWYNSEEDKYIVCFCGFGGEFLDVADGNWFTYDAMHIFYILPPNLHKFIKTFVEISKEEFDNRLKCALDATAAELDEWIDYYRKEDTE